MDANFARVVSAEDGAILHERDRQPKPRRRNCRRDARNAAPDNHKIVRRIRNLRLDARDYRRRAALDLNPIAPTVESGQILQFKRMRPLRERDLPRRLNRPFALSRHAKFVRQNLAVHENAEASRRNLRPWGRPVLRASGDEIIPRLPDRECRAGVFNGPSQTMREQIGRPSFPLNYSLLQSRPLSAKL